MTNDAALQRHAREAYLGFASRASVLLWFGNDLAEGFASGLILRTPGGKPFVLTARHMVDRALGWKPLRIMIPELNGRNLFDAGEEAYPGPQRPIEDVDVAVVTIREEFHDVLRPLALGLDVVGEDETTAADDVLFVTGFPTALAFQSPESAREWLFTRLRLVTGITGRDSRGRLTVDWSGGPFSGSPPHPKLGREGTLVHPVGISGGELWRVRGPAQRTLWAPDTHVRLIGVPVAFDKPNAEYVEPVSLWATWLHDRAARMDAVDSP